MEFIHILGYQKTTKENGFRKFKMSNKIFEYSFHIHLNIQKMLQQKLSQILIRPHYFNMKLEVQRV